MYKIKKKIEINEVTDLETGDDILMVEVANREKGRTVRKAFTKYDNHYMRSINKAVADFIREGCEELW